MDELCGFIPMHGQQQVEMSWLALLPSSLHLVTFLMFFILVHMHVTFF